MRPIIVILQRGYDSRCFVQGYLDLVDEVEETLARCREKMNPGNDKEMLLRLRRKMG